MARVGTNKVFTAVEPVIPDRADHWGVVSATFAGQSRVVSIKGTWHPVSGRPSDAVSATSKGGGSLVWVGGGATSPGGGLQTL